MGRRSQAPKLKVDACDELPIFGIPLISYKEKGDSEQGKGGSGAGPGSGWAVFSKMIMQSANYDKANREMIFKSLLDKGADYDETREYIERAMTCGVPIINHGEDEDFKQKVDSFNNLLFKYNSQQELQKHDKDVAPGN